MRLLLLNLPAIDGVAAAVKLGERLVALSSGRSPSRRFALTLAA
ncbi:hypothetical protein [Devosia sp. Root105]|nr:hypothetical protein [Devosia sp. Root105]